MNAPNLVGEAFPKALPTIYISTITAKKIIKIISTLQQSLAMASTMKRQIKVSLSEAQKLNQIWID